MSDPGDTMASPTSKTTTASVSRQQEGSNTAQCPPKNAWTNQEDDGQNPNEDNHKETHPNFAHEKEYGHTHEHNHNHETEGSSHTKESERNDLYSMDPVDFDRDSPQPHEGDFISVGEMPHYERYENQHTGDENENDNSFDQEDEDDRDQRRKTGVNDDDYGPDDGNDGDGQEPFDEERYANDGAAVSDSWLANDENDENDDEHGRLEQQQSADIDGQTESDRDNENDAENDAVKPETNDEPKDRKEASDSASGVKTEKKKTGKAPLKKRCMVYVRDLDGDVNEQDLRTAFSPYGNLGMISFEDTARSLAYIRFTSIEEAAKAAEVMNGATIGSKTIKVEHPEVNSMICASNLPLDMDLPSIRRWFESFGTVEQLKLMCKADGASKGYCYVEYKNHSEASNARVHAPSRLMGDRNLRVDMFDCFEDASYDSTCLFIDKLPLSIKDELQFRALFDGLEDLKDAYLPVDNHGHSRGHGFVEFHTIESADSARDKLNDLEVKGSKLRISYIIPSKSISTIRPATRNPAKNSNQKSSTVNKMNTGRQYTASNQQTNRDMGSGRNLFNKNPKGNRSIPRGNLPNDARMRPQGDRRGFPHPQRMPRPANTAPFQGDRNMHRTEPGILDSTQPFPRHQNPAGTHHQGGVNSFSRQNRGPQGNPRNPGFGGQMQGHSNHPMGHIRREMTQQGDPHFPYQGGNEHARQPIFQGPRDMNPIHGNEFVPGFERPHQGGYEPSAPALGFGGRPGSGNQDRNRDAARDRHWINQHDDRIPRREQESHMNAPFPQQRQGQGQGQFQRSGQEPHNHFNWNPNRQPNQRETGQIPLGENARFQSRMDMHEHEHERGHEREVGRERGRMPYHNEQQYSQSPILSHDQYASADVQRRSGHHGQRLQNTTGLPHHNTAPNYHQHQHHQQQGEYHGAVLQEYPTQQQSNVAYSYQSQQLGRGGAGSVLGAAPNADQRQQKQQQQQQQHYQGASGGNSRAASYNPQGTSYGSQSNTNQSRLHVDQGVASNKRPLANQHNQKQQQQYNQHNQQGTKQVPQNTKHVKPTPSNQHSVGNQHSQHFQQQTVAHSGNKRQMDQPPKATAIIPIANGGPIIVPIASQSAIGASTSASFAQRAIQSSQTSLQHSQYTQMHSNPVLGTHYNTQPILGTDVSQSYGGYANASAQAMQASYGYTQNYNGAYNQTSQSAVLQSYPQSYGQVQYSQVSGAGSNASANMYSAAGSEHKKARR